MAELQIISKTTPCWDNSFKLGLFFFRTSEGIWFYLGPHVSLWSGLVNGFCLCFLSDDPLFMTSHPHFLLFFVVQVRVHVLVPTQPHGHILVFRNTDTGKTGSGAPHSDLNPLGFTIQHSGQPWCSAGSRLRSQRAPTSQRWDPRLAWRRVFDVVLSCAALLCYRAFN